MRLKNKCRFNNVGNKPKAATSPLGIETLSCDHGRITKQTRLPLLRPPWKKQAKLHWAKLLRLGFALQPCADTENLKWADSWALWLFSFIVLINKVSWCQVMRKTSRERMIFFVSFQKIPLAFTYTCCVYSNMPIFYLSLLRRKVIFWHFFYFSKTSRMFKIIIRLN